MGDQAGWVFRCERDNLLRKRKLKIKVGTSNGKSLLYIAQKTFMDISYVVSSERMVP